jgi:hypothetical protein
MIIIEIMLKFLRGLKNSNIVEVIVGLQIAVLSVVVLLQVFFVMYSIILWLGQKNYLDFYLYGLFFWELQSA